MGKLESANDISKFLETKWFEKSGLITSMLITAAAEIGFLTTVKLPWWVGPIVVAASWILLAIIWWISKQPPQIQKGSSLFQVGSLKSSLPAMR